MAAWRYKISLRVLKKYFRVSAANKVNIFQHIMVLGKRGGGGRSFTYLLSRAPWSPT